MRITPENITELKNDEVFVFGSNLAGRHLGGAAKFAHEKLGYPLGVSEGQIGQAYAIPTLDENFKKLHLGLIRFYTLVARDKIINKRYSKIKFYITPIGCGIAGFAPDEIAPMFERFLDLKNVYLPKSFLKVIYKDKPWYDIASKLKLTYLKCI